MKIPTHALPVLVAGLAVFAVAAASAGQERKTRVFRFKYETTIRDIPTGAKSLDVWLPYPLTDSNQTIRQVTIRVPGTVTIGREPMYGNEALFYHLDNPKGPVELTLEITATRRENAGELDVLSPTEAQ